MQETILKDLDGLEHVVQFRMSGALYYDRSMWHAVVLQPYGRLLEHSDAPYLIARVASDVAQAISDCASRGIAHRDVTAGNFVEYQQRGYLFDFSAAKVVIYGRTYPNMLACLWEHVPVAMVLVGRAA